MTEPMTPEEARADAAAPEKTKWSAERTAHPDAKADGWAIVYDPTPGGIVQDNGKRYFSLRFPALLIADCVSDPEQAAKDVAAALNASEKSEGPAHADQAEEIERLREALRPFAELDMRGDPFTWGDNRPVFGRNDTAVTTDDFRQARAALEGGE